MWAGESGLKQLTGHKARTDIAEVCKSAQSPLFGRQWRCSKIFNRPLDPCLSLPGSPAKAVSVGTTTWCSRIHKEA